MNEMNEYGDTNIQYENQKEKAANKEELENLGLPILGRAYAGKGNDFRTAKNSKHARKGKSRMRSLLGSQKGSDKRRRGNRRGNASRNGNRPVKQSNWQESKYLTMGNNSPTPKGGAGK